MPELVALQTMLPKFETPVESQGKVLQLRQLANANQVADMELAQRRQAMADDQAARAAFSANPNDSSARLAALAGVSPSAYGAEAKRQADLAKIGADTAESQLKTVAKAFEVHRDRINLVNTPQDAEIWVKEAFADPITAPIVSRVGDLQTALSKIPQDPAGFQKWKVQAGLAANEYVKHTSVDANTAANNAVSVANNAATNQRLAAEGRANRENALKIEGMKSERQQAKGSAEASLNDDTLNMMAAQYLRGDKSVLQNLGRGAQGAANLVALRERITDQAKAAGMSGGDIASVMADYAGQTAGLRTSGTISARIENAAAEAEQLAPLAIEAGRQVARSGFLPFGRAQVMFNNQTNDPALNRFATANIGLATAYAGAMARGQKATVSDNEHARELLTTAKSQEAYEAIVDQMKQEIAAAQRAPKHVREALRSEISGKGGGHGAAPTAPAIQPGWTVTEVK